MRRQWRRWWRWRRGWGGAAGGGAHTPAAMQAVATCIGDVVLRSASLPIQARASVASDSWAVKMVCIARERGGGQHRHGASVEMLSDAQDAGGAGIREVVKPHGHPSLLARQTHAVSVEPGRSCPRRHVVAAAHVVYLCCWARAACKGLDGLCVAPSAQHGHVHQACTGGEGPGASTSSKVCRGDGVRT